MVTEIVHRETPGQAEPEVEAGPALRSLLLRRGWVLLSALLLMVLAEEAGHDADKLTSGAYLDPAAESHLAAEVLAEKFPGGPANLVLIAEASADTGDSAAAAASGRELTRRLAKMPAWVGCTRTERPRVRASAPYADDNCQCR